MRKIQPFDIGFFPMARQPKVMRFHGEYRFLSNFWFVDIFYDERHYKSVEHAYQAAKMTSEPSRRKVANAESAGNSKTIARSLPMRPDWEDVKISIMLALLRIKFKNPSLREKLNETDDMELIEGNHWNDTFWGVCNGVGENWLGKLLMQVRDENRRGDA
jgi:ribA/ribD-fused uncharacterized protein